MTNQTQAIGPNDEPWSDPPLHPNPAAEPPSHHAHATPPGVVIPGPAEEVAEEIAHVSPEGRPADAKSGPVLLWGELGVALAFIVLFAVGFGLWRGWVVGLVVLGIGLLALAFNPVVSATIQHIGDRGTVADRHSRRI